MKTMQLKAFIIGIMITVRVGEEKRTYLRKIAINFIFLDCIRRNFSFLHIQLYILPKDQF